MKISVILPTYNEIESVPLVIERILAVVPRNVGVEIIVVDDCSPDGTAAKVKRIFANDKRVRVIVRKNKTPGLGNSIYDGIKVSLGDIIIGLDADGNHPPELIPALLDALRHHADASIASRFISSQAGFKKFREMGSLLFNAIIRWFWQYPVWDNTSGYYAIKRDVLFSLPLKDIFLNTYGEYHIRLMYTLLKKGYTITEVPVIYENRIGGKSKSPLGRMFITYLIEAYRWKTKLDRS